MALPFVPTLVNMIPKSLSAETHQDSEPHLTVNPANTQQIVGTAFTPPPTPGPNAPIFVSLNGGTTWLLNNIVPSATGSFNGTKDITASFNGAGTQLYAAILRDNGTNSLILQFLRTNNISGGGPMTILSTRNQADQPFVHAMTRAGSDRVYIGDNDFGVLGGQTQTLDQSLNAALPIPAFSSVRVEKRATSGQNGPQCRPASHSDGTVYAAYYGWRATAGVFQSNTLVITSADVVVVRHDEGASAATPFTSLTDPGDGLAGFRVAKNVSFPFNINGTAATGQQRIGGSISIAVDPRNSGTVYVAWGDRQAGSFLTLHVRRSTDRGLTWSGDLLTVNNACNAALAVNQDGVVGFLRQEVTGSGGTQQWITRVSLGQDGANWNHFVLAQTSAVNPVKAFDPYLGDYDHLLTVGRDFYGVFSASNVPSRANFPFGVRYQRNANFNNAQLLDLNNTTPVAPSIDPFFFRLTQSATAVAIASAQFGTFLQMDATGFNAFALTGGGNVTCQSTAGTMTQVRLEEQQDGTFAIASQQFPGAYLRLDGTGAAQWQASGGGVVNCQFGGAGAWEKFKLVPQGDGTFAIESVQFPGVCLRMDGGGGTVNTQYGAGAWEKFRIVSV